MESGFGTRSDVSVRRRMLLVALLAALLVMAGCELPSFPGTSRPVDRPASTATPVSPLASQTIYWSQNALRALRASDGKIRWQMEVKWASCGNNGCAFTYGPLMSTLDSDTLYSLGTNDHNTGAVYAIAASDGTTLWQTPVAGCMTEPVGTPLVVDGVVYVALSGHASGNFSCGPSGWVYALRESDGHVLWRAPFERVVWATLALTNGVIVVANSTYPASPEVFSLTGLRASDGKQLWRVTRTKILSNFTAADGVVITSGRASARYASGMSVEAFRASDGAHLWESVIISSQSVASTPFLANGTAYVHGGDGYLYALRATDGHIMWRFHTDVRSMGAPAYANGRLYVGIGPTLDVLNATSGALVRSYHVFDQPAVSDDPNYIWSVPVVTGAVIFVSAGVFDCPGGCRAMDQLGGKLYALDTATGRLLWQYQSPRGFSVTTPLLGD